MFGQQVPVEPTRVVVLAIGVIVAALTTPHLIAHNKHGHTHRQHTGSEKVLHLPVAKPSISGSSVGPSTPQFQLRFSSRPSRLSSPFSSLCLWL